jgi:hypothetical protein
MKRQFQLPTAVTHLFDKGTGPSVDHQNVGRLPARHLPARILVTSRVPLGCVYIGIAKIIVGIVNILCDGSSVRWDSKQCLPMIVSVLSKKTVGDLESKEASGEVDSAAKGRMLMVEVEFSAWRPLRGFRTEAYPNSRQNQQQKN